MYASLLSYVSFVVDDDQKEHYVEELIPQGYAYESPHYSIRTTRDFNNRAIDVTVKGTRYTGARRTNVNDGSIHAL